MNFAQIGINDVFKRLTSSIYIHSATENFVDMSEAYLTKINNIDKKEYSSEAVRSELASSYQMLKGQIDTITALCNDFYRKLGITATDSYSFGKDGPPMPHLDGAKEFQRRFLMNKGSNNSYTQRILNVMNTEQYQKECIRRMRSQRNNLSNSPILKSQEFKDLMEVLGSQLGLGTKDIWRIPANITEQVVEDSVNALLNTTTSTSKRGVKSTRVRFKKSVSNNINKIIKSNDAISDLFTDKGRGLNLNTNAGVKRAVELFKGYFSRKSVSSFANIMWDVLVSMDSGASQLIKKTDFLTFFSDELANYGNIDFMTNIPAFTGMQSEQPFVFAMNLDLDQIFNKNNLNKMTVKTLGQTQETRKFRAGPDLTAQSGADFVFEVKDENGKTTQQFRIQSKNSFKDTDYLDIRMNDEIKLDTYARRILSDEESRNLEYFLLNRAFLSEYGMVSGHQQKYDEIIHTSGSNTWDLYKNHWLEHSLEDYVAYFLNETIAYLIAGKVYNEGKGWNANTQNLFFIFKGKYLIPVSLFLHSALYLIWELFCSSKEARDLSRKSGGGGSASTIGRLTYKKELKKLHASANIAKKMRYDKFYYLNHRLEPQYQEDHDSMYGSVFKERYPENLVSIGSAVGHQFLKEAAFPKINFKMRLQRINDLLRI